MKILIQSYCVILQIKVKNVCKSMKLFHEDICISIENIQLLKLLVSKFFFRVMAHFKMRIKCRFQFNHGVLYIKLQLKKIAIQCSLVHKDVSIAIHNIPLLRIFFKCCC